jgi:hypothetical protein
MLIGVATTAGLEQLYRVAMQVFCEDLPTTGVTDNLVPELDPGPCNSLDHGLQVFDLDDDPQGNGSPAVSRTRPDGLWHGHSAEHVLTFAVKAAKVVVYAGVGKKAERGGLAALDILVK